MIKKNFFTFLLVVILISHCSFDNKTGIWSGGQEEKERISDLEKEQRKILDVSKIYSSDDSYTTEVNLK